MWKCWMMVEHISTILERYFEILNQRVNNRSKMTSMSKQVIAETIKLTVTIDGKEHGLELRNVDLGLARQDFLSSVEELAMMMVLQLQKNSIIPYTDFAVIDDENGRRTLGER